ncbi:unnamed protein product [Candidula unifasciata]|uniref:Uncharacterized protein n=1 Tax=Candidula unifasciata TaxID=100452 RepID=A0A8S3YTX6_9EUPU|nr:unnamed protein product [Candidula unifasciata]
MSSTVSSTSGKSEAGDIEMSTIEHETAAVSVDKRDDTTSEGHIGSGSSKAKSESSSTEERDQQSPKEKGVDEHPDIADGYDPFSEQSLGPLMSSNQYSMRKTASQALMDVALMMANISQLRTLLTAGGDIDYSVLLIVMVALSLSFQLLFAILIFIIWMRESEQHQKDDYLKALRELADAKSETDTAEMSAARNSYLRRQISYLGHRITSHLNYITMVLVFIITVINMFITGFGIKLEPSADHVQKSNSS